MLMVVRTDDTPATLAPRRAALAAEVAAIASAPVRHLPAEFLAAVEGLFPQRVEPRLSAARS
ncbi:MAG: hypothetical protein LC789_04945 [Actinobacteria bacterium]|nr:hypothetical protein [Actinomycetota bacterium]